MLNRECVPLDSLVWKPQDRNDSRISVEYDEGTHWLCNKCVPSLHSTDIVHLYSPVVSTPESQKVRTQINNVQVGVQS